MDICDLNGMEILKKGKNSIIEECIIKEVKYSHTTEYGDQIKITLEEIEKKSISKYLIPIALNKSIKFKNNNKDIEEFINKIELLSDIRKAMEEKGFKSFVHLTDFTNLSEILDSGYLKSREKANIIYDNCKENEVSKERLEHGHKSEFIKSCVRLYLRPVNGALFSMYQKQKKDNNEKDNSVIIVYDYSIVYSFLENVYFTFGGADNFKDTEFEVNSKGNLLYIEEFYKHSNEFWKIFQSLLEEEKDQNIIRSEIVIKGEIPNGMIKQIVFPNEELQNSFKQNDKFSNFSNKCIVDVKYFKN